MSQHTSKRQKTTHKYKQTINDTNAQTINDTMPLISSPDLPLLSSCNDVAALSALMASNAVGVGNEVNNLITLFQRTVESYEAKEAEETNDKVTIQTLQERSTALHNQTMTFQADLEKARADLLIARTAQLSLQRSATHPDPDVFTGEKRNLLEPFLRHLQLKLKINQDWYPTPQHAMAYAMCRLGGKALDQFASHNKDGVIDMGSVDEMIALLRVSFGEGEGKEAAQLKLRKLHQGSQLLADFLPEWVAIAGKTGYNDEALISQLKYSLHKEILVRLSFLPLSTGTLTYKIFLDQVRKADSTLSSLNPNYTKLPSHDQSHGHANHSNDPVGDLMDLSVVWTEEDVKSRRRPKTDKEKKARIMYCKEHKLCIWCSSDKHFAGTCVDAPWNKKDGKDGKGEGKA